MKLPEVIIIGGGILGLATAYTISLQRPLTRVLLLEKEPGLARHQTGRNSGVIHSGIYYKPGSYKARNCRRGKALLESFCEREELAFERCGKVIVATAGEQIPRLEALAERAVHNEVACRPLHLGELRELEPHVRGVAALHIPETGIVDYPAVCRRLARLATSVNTEIMLGSRVTRVRNLADSVAVETDQGDFCGDLVINCAGLYSDWVARSSGLNPGLRIVPFRGEYFELVANRRHLCRNLIYPVPDPAFPFLGVHFTRTVTGGVECGPNAVLALAREGYSWKRVRPGELWDTLSYPAFWKLAARHWRMGLEEVYRSLSKAAFTRALQALIPEIQAADLRPAPAGVRAQALADDGRLLDDFAFRRQGRVLHVCNAPSPAATSALAIAEAILEQLWSQ